MIFIYIPNTSTSHLLLHRYPEAMFENQECAQNSIAYCLLHFPHSSSNKLGYYPMFKPNHIIHI